MITKSKIIHPSPYSRHFLPIFAELLEGYERVLDPMAGIGRVHQLRRWGHDTVGVEIEKIWADARPGTVMGNALALPFDDSSFDAIVVSPSYGNRMSDRHNARDGSIRRSYTHDLREATGDPNARLHSDNSGAMPWGAEYREFHQKAWPESIRVLRPGGRFVLNIADHIRKGKRQPVSAWHARTLMECGLVLVDVVTVATQKLRRGTNHQLRVDGEMIWVFAN